MQYFFKLNKGSRVLMGRETDSFNTSTQCLQHFQVYYDIQKNVIINSKLFGNLLHDRILLLDNVFHQAARSSFQETSS